MIEADCSGNGAGSVLARSCPLARDDGTGTALHRPSPLFRRPSLILHSFPAHPRACPATGARLCARSFALRPGATARHPRAPIIPSIVVALARFTAFQQHPSTGSSLRPDEGLARHRAGRKMRSKAAFPAPCRKRRAVAHATMPHRNKLDQKPFASGWIAPRCTAASARYRLQGEQNRRRTACHGARPAAGIHDARTWLPFHGGFPVPAPLINR